MSRPGRWRGSDVSSQEPPPPRPSSHSRKLTWHAETETSRCAGRLPYFSYLLFFPFFATSSAPAAVAVGVASISQDGDDVEFGLSIVIVNTLGASTNVWGNHVCYLHSVLMTSMCDTCKHLLSVMVATIRCMHILELIMIL